VRFGFKPWPLALPAWPTSSDLFDAQKGNSKQPQGQSWWERVLDAAVALAPAVTGVAAAATVAGSLVNSYNARQALQLIEDVDDSEERELYELVVPSEYQRGYKQGKLQIADQHKHGELEGTKGSMLQDVEDNGKFVGPVGYRPVKYKRY